MTLMRLGAIHWSFSSINRLSPPIVKKRSNLSWSLTRLTASTSKTEDNSVKRPIRWWELIPSLTRLVVPISKSPNFSASAMRLYMSSLCCSCNWILAANVAASMRLGWGVIDLIFLLRGRIRLRCLGLASARRGIKRIKNGYPLLSQRTSAAKPYWN